MSKKTPSKVDKINTTYHDCAWTINSRGTVYARVKPALAKQLGASATTTFHRLGRVKTVQWTKALRIPQESSYEYVFKFFLCTEPFEIKPPLQPKDYPDTWFALKESKLTDLSQDKQAKVHFNNNFSRCEKLHDAHKQALTANTLKKDGKWLKALYPSGQNDNTAVSPAITNPNKAAQDKTPRTTAWTQFETVPNVNDHSKSQASSSSSSVQPPAGTNPLLPQQNLFLSSQGDPPGAQGNQTIHTTQQIQCILPFTNTNIHPRNRTHWFKTHM